MIWNTPENYITSVRQTILPNAQSAVTPAHISLSPLAASERGIAIASVLNKIHLVHRWISVTATCLNLSWSSILITVNQSQLSRSSISGKTIIEIYLGMQIGNWTGSLPRNDRRHVKIAKQRVKSKRSNLIQFRWEEKLNELFPSTWGFASDIKALSIMHELKNSVLLR